MGRIRTYKPEFFSSGTIGALRIETRYLFLGLISMADDYGVVPEILRKILGDIFPWDPHITDADIEDYLLELQNASLIVRCVHDGRTYIVIRTWEEHQRVDRPGKRTIPADVHKGAIGLDAGESREYIASDSRDYLDESLYGKGKEQGKEQGKGTGKRNRESSPDHELYLTSWNELARDAGIPTVVSLSDARRKHLTARIAEPLFVERWGDVLAGIRGSPFLRGENDRGWTATFDWIIENDTNFKKIIEGRYAGTRTGTGKRNSLPPVPERYRAKLLGLPVGERRNALATIADPEQYDLSSIGI